jgi:serine/threonine protein kinase
MSERRCPKCGSVYTDTGARFCPKDGSMLVEIQARKPAAPAAPAAGGGSGTGVRTPLPPGKAGLDRASSLSNQILDARYQVMKKLGEGGMSYVYLAKEISSDETVAIKVLSPRLASDKSSVERLRREAGLAMRLDHPNVCRILRLGESEDGLIYLVMPFLKGELLSDREVRGGPMDMTLGVTLLKQMCAGLHHAHELQIIHRDLKPENVMLDREGHVKVMDFGIAHSPAFGDTAPGAVIGTPSYMAPEQASGGGQIDARTDIYLFGLLLYEMYAGSAVGQDLQPGRIAELLQEHRDVIPEAVAQVITRCLERAPSARYQSANEVAVALQLEPASGMANIASVPLGLRLFAVATAVEEELAGLNANLEGPCTRTETWQRLPEFLEKRRVITASTARSLELFRSIVSFSTKWKDWSESEMATKVELGKALIPILRAIPAPEFTVEEVDIVLFQDESCITPLPQPVGVRVNIRYSDGSDALRMYPAGRKFRIGEQVRPWWETRRPYTRIYYRDSSGKPALAWDFAFPFVGFTLGAAATQGQ